VDPREDEPLMAQVIAADAEPVIRISGVTKSFGDFVAVDGIDLDIHRGEFFALLGGSGCGKTTLLRMIAGFETPTQGKIAIESQDVSQLPPYLRPVNMMFQSYALFPHMSVADNIAFGLRRAGVNSTEIAKRVSDVLDLVQLGQFAKRKPHQLSGGQRQRVALARSIVTRPKVLLLDEPLSALDKKLREQTQFELMNIQQQIGITFVVVTHDQQEAMTMASRIAVMDKGRIVQLGPPNEIYEFPESRFVADFIGNVNIFEGVLAEDEPDHALIACDDAGTSFYIGHGVQGTVGTELAVAVRPEKITLDFQQPSATAPNKLSGTIKEIGYLGDTCVYHVALPTGKQVRVTQPIRERWSEQTVSHGDIVHLSWSANAGVVLRK
jgi:putrescine transport system ATP-binding protein